MRSIASDSILSMFVLTHSCPHLLLFRLVLKSIADLTVLAAITALEVTTEEAKIGNSDYKGELDVEFKYGRPDINCECEEDFLPPALTSDGSAYNFKVLDDTMGATTMGFTRQEITALMGTHTLGGMSSDFSCFQTSFWVNDPAKFDNGKSERSI